MKNKVVNILLVILLIFIYGYIEFIDKDEKIVVDYIKNDIPSYSGEDIIILNNNEPVFDLDNISNKSFEEYGHLDNLGRCSYAYALIGTDLMPTKDRERITSIKPTGWHTCKYDFIEDELLYNRCHLIAYALTGENANKRNLITCTRHMNYDLMREYENKTIGYIKRTNNHVLYRVTPVFDDDNLIAKGVQMEAYSLEDEGKGIKFNIFIYNVQPQITINYKNGDNSKTIEK